MSLAKAPAAVTVQANHQHVPDAPLSLDASRYVSDHTKKKKQRPEEQQEHDGHTGSPSLDKHVLAQRGMRLGAVGRSRRARRTRVCSAQAIGTSLHWGECWQQRWIRRLQWCMRMGPCMRGRWGRQWSNKDSNRVGKRRGGVAADCIGCTRHLLPLHIALGVQSPPPPPL